METIVLGKNQNPLKIKRIAINTGGGDAPGLNAVIRAITVSAINKGWEVYGIRKGYMGLMPDWTGPEEGVIRLDRQRVRGITHLGGTILGTTNKGNPFEYPVKGKDGKTVPTDISDTIVTAFKKRGFDALVAIGGDGSLGIAAKLMDKGIPVVGVPKTIDNDLSSTVITFGFDTAVTNATDAIDKLHSTAESHERCLVIEVMGRYAGWIALNSGVSGSADVIIIPEIPFDIDKICAKVSDRDKTGRRFTIVVVAEGAAPKGGSMSTQGEKEIGREVKLGGIADQIAKEIQKRIGKETRTMVLGHLQRGGGPTTFDRLIALRFGAAAVRCLNDGLVNVMVALNPPQVVAVPLKDAIAKMKAVPTDCDTIKTAREMGISFGD
ncbi:MAG TPA: ATP-dependent 6-phosphofructokinase [Planctomycetota bacterium]|nr:ATP-dependent 6-phosphofructokinase [Planctomycetota bacterium]